MLAELTPEQAFELCAYHGIEPFGEVRDDLRMAHVLRCYFDSKRAKGQKRIPLGSLTLYPDIIESAEEQSGTQELQATLSKFAKVSTDDNG